MATLNKEYEIEEISVELWEEHGIRSSEHATLLGFASFEQLLQSSAVSKYVNYRWSTRSGRFLYKGRCTREVAYIVEEQMISAAAKQMKRERGRKRRRRAVGNARTEPRRMPAERRTDDGSEQIHKLQADFEALKLQQIRQFGDLQTKQFLLETEIAQRDKNIAQLRHQLQQLHVHSEAEIWKLRDECGFLNQKLEEAKKEAVSTKKDLQTMRLIGAKCRKLRICDGTGFKWTSNNTEFTILHPLTLRAKLPAFFGMPINAGETTVQYYECKIGKLDSMISIGFTGQVDNNTNLCMKIWSWGGIEFQKLCFGLPYTAIFATGDVIGAGLVQNAELGHWQFFFTKNGTLIAGPFRIPPVQGPVYPMATLHNDDDALETNFGSSSFIYELILHPYEMAVCLEDFEMYGPHKNPAA